MGMGDMISIRSFDFVLPVLLGKLGLAVTGEIAETGHRLP
jgi:hypothetical protein